ncbi:MAG TPA: ATP-binding protein [Caldisericia bacterium]|nr:ATP-binding protein [Caldisericia bacterium]
MKFFSSLRFQVVASFFILVVLATFFLGSLLIRQTETNLLNVENEKLTIIAKQLALAYDRVIEKFPTMAETLKVDYETVKKFYLERSLDDYTSPVHEQNPDFGVGFFIYGESFNRPVAFYESESLLSEKTRVILPLYERGEEIGYVWIEEPKDIIYSKINELKQTQRNIIIYVVIISGLFSLYISTLFVRRVTVLKNGLGNLKSDLTYKLPKMSGELGDISYAINDLSQTLYITRSNSEKILESINSGVMVLSKDGIIKDINRAVEELLEIKRKDVLNKRFLDFPILKELLSDIKIKDNIKEKRIKIGKSEKIFNINSSPFNSEEILITIDDVTEEVKLLEEKRKTEALKTLGIFTTGVAHEIRNPLTSIKGFTQILEKRLESKEEEMKYISTILSEIKRLEDIVKDLLTYGRPSPPNKIQSNLSNVIKDSISLLSDKLKEKNLKVEYDTSFDPKFNFDPKQMEQVALNLIMNAIDSSDYGSKIIVRMKKYEEGVLLEIKDFGFGIKEEDKEKIFTPFFTTKERGTGLGLSISQKIVEMHNGRIWFASNIEGTSFFVYLPIL